MSRQKIQDVEFDDWLQLEGEDTNWVAQQAAQRLPLVLPWKRQAIRLGTCFDSRRLDTDPWLKENPFILSDFYMIPKVLQMELGCTSDFNSVSTSRKTETGKHLSLGFGVGVGLPFLCSVSVKGTYDEQLKENKDVSWKFSAVFYLHISLSTNSHMGDLYSQTRAPSEQACDVARWSLSATPACATRHSSC